MLRQKGEDISAKQREKGGFWGALVVVARLPEPGKDLEFFACGPQFFSFHSKVLPKSFRKR